MISLSSTTHWSRGVRPAGASTRHHLTRTSRPNLPGASADPDPVDDQTFQVHLYRARSPLAEAAMILSATC